MDGTTAEAGIREPAANGDKPEEPQFDPSRSKGKLHMLSSLLVPAGSACCSCSRL